MGVHQAYVRIIDKQGQLNNPADRDHCIQYMIAVPLIFWHLMPEIMRMISPLIIESIGCGLKSSVLKAQHLLKTVMTHKNERSVMVSVSGSIIEANSMKSLWNIELDMLVAVRRYSSINFEVQTNLGRQFPENKAAAYS